MDWDKKIFQVFLIQVANNDWSDMTFADDPHINVYVH